MKSEQIKFTVRISKANAVRKQFSCTSGSGTSLTKSDLGCSEPRLNSPGEVGYGSRLPADLNCSLYRRPNFAPCSRTPAGHQHKAAVRSQCSSSDLNHTENWLRSFINMIHFMIKSLMKESSDICISNSGCCHGFFSLLVSLIHL